MGLRSKIRLIVFGLGQGNFEYSSIRFSVVDFYETVLNFGELFISYLHALKWSDFCLFIGRGMVVWLASLLRRFRSFVG